MPLTELSTDFIQAVLRRTIINELRYPRICAARQCRRHKRCGDMAVRNPRCLASLHPIDLKPLTELMQMAIDILESRYPPRQADDFATQCQEYEAINVLLACTDDLPDLIPRILVWCKRYSDPSVLPVGAPRWICKLHATLAPCPGLDDIPVT